MSPKLLEVCVPCLADATERLAHEVLVLSSIWTKPDVSIYVYAESAYDDHVVTWHAPMGLTTAALRNGVTNLN